MLTDPYATGVLVKEHHDRLVADIDNFAADAGIQAHWLWQHLGETCGEVAVEYVRRFNHHRHGGEIAGLCLVRGSSSLALVEPHMAAIAAALVRNFVRARVITLGRVLQYCAAGDPPEATCLLIPNFFIPKQDGGTIASWQVSALYDLLIQRQALGLQTVVYVSDMSGLEKEYGLAFSSLIKHAYISTKF
jgi:hypothetical protein